MIHLLVDVVTHTPISGLSYQRCCLVAVSGCRRKRRERTLIGGQRRSLILISSRWLAQPQHIRCDGVGGSSREPALAVPTARCNVGRRRAKTHEARGGLREEIEGAFERRCTN